MHQQQTMHQHAPGAHCPQNQLPGACATLVMMMLMGTRGSNHTNNKSKPSHDQLATSHPPHPSHRSKLPGEGGGGAKRGRGKSTASIPLVTPSAKTQKIMSSQWCMPLPMSNEQLEVQKTEAQLQLETKQQLEKRWKEKGFDKTSAKLNKLNQS